LSNLDTASLENFLAEFDCFICTEIQDIQLAINLNKACRSKGVRFLMADVCGLFSWSFSDFGSEFNVADLDGEEYSENYISSIKIGQSSVIEVLDKKFHNLEDDDCVKFYEVQGMVQLNNQTAKVKIINSYTFSIDLDLSKFDPYTSNGLFKRVKKHKLIQFRPLDEQLDKPDLTLSDLSEVKFSQPYLIHVAMHAIHRLWMHAEELRTYSNYLKLAVDELGKRFEADNSIQLNVEDLKRICCILYATKNAQFPSLCAFIGGIVAQEAIKSITNKFSPIKQWFHLDCMELYECSINPNEMPTQKITKNDRYDNLRECFGGEMTLEKLKSLRLFMVGCGAIGCEMMKNYALLGVSCSDKGLVSITDNDLIEKSNLNRQFLFRQEDIQKSKSLSAQAATLRMNPDMKINAYEKKVCPQSENQLFTDEFFKSHDLCVNALDNVEARRYMDSRCVGNQKPLLESGTLGPKG